MHAQWSGAFLGFSPVRQKKKNQLRISRQVFPWAALGWAVLDFFVKFIIILLAPTLLPCNFYCNCSYVCSCRVCMIFIVNF